MNFYVDKKPKSCDECPCYQALDKPITYGEPSAHGGFAAGLYVTHTCGIENCADPDGTNQCPLVEIKHCELNSLSITKVETIKAMRVECSRCGAFSLTPFYRKDVEKVSETRFCPCCGAKVRK